MTRFPLRVLQCDNYEISVKVVSCPRNHFYRTSVTIMNSCLSRGGCFWLFRALCKIDHVNDVADEIDLHLVGADATSIDGSNCEVLGKK